MDIADNLKDGHASEGEISIPLPNGETCSATLRHCVSFGGRHCKKPKPWRGRLKSWNASHLQLLEGPPRGPAIFSNLTLLDKQGYYLPPLFPHDFSDGSGTDMAWIDLHGRLLNADTATSLTRVGGQLGEKEKSVWQGLCPLQRVLVIAVAAAAAAAAKLRNASEVVRLQGVLKEQETALVLIKEELSNSLQEVNIKRSQLNMGRRDPSPSDSLDDLVDLLSQVDMEGFRSNAEEACSSIPTLDCEVNNLTSRVPNDKSVLMSDASNPPSVSRQLKFSDLTRISPIKEESPNSGGPGLELVEKLSMSNSWIEALDIGFLLEEVSEAQEHQMVAQPEDNGIVLQRESDVEQENLRSKEAWETVNTEVFDTIQDYGNCMEWLSETSSVIMDPFSPMPSEKVHGNPLKRSEDGGQICTMQEGSFSSRARCASIILDVKTQVISLLDEAASNVLEALMFITDKIQQLEGSETNTLTPREPEAAAWNRKHQASAAIKENVNKASMRIAALQNAVMHLWDSLGPEAMAALHISPSDFDDYLTNMQIAKILNGDACEFSTESGDVRSWQEWFRRGFDNPESSFLRRIQVSAEKESDVNCEGKLLERIEQPTPWPPSGATYAGRKLGSRREDSTPATVAVRQKVEKLMAALFENMQEAESGKKSPDLMSVAEEILAEFAKSAAKASSLKKYVKACDLKRKQVERKLLEAWEQDSKNQAKASSEITELKRQVRLKETAYRQLITSRKALVSSKTKEIGELREDCRRQNLALKDMAEAAKATQEGSEKRLAMLEEICRKKDISIMSLKEEIFELEGKVQELQACQTPAQLRPMNLPPDDRDTDTESADDLFDNENCYGMVRDDCQLRGSSQSMCGSENRRTSWGSDLSAQEFHIIDTPWSSELNAGQDFNVIEEAAFQGRSLSIFQNVTSSQEFLRSSLRKLGTTPGGGLDTSNGNGNSGPIPSTNDEGEARMDNNAAVSEYRKAVSKSVSGLPAFSVTSRSKRREDKLRASTGVLSAVGPNTPFKPTRSTPASIICKERSGNGFKPKENRARQKWV